MHARHRGLASIVSIIWALCAPCAVWADSGRTDELVARAIAALQEARPGEALWHARQAMRTDPDHAEAARVFQAAWLLLDERGAMNTGRTIDEIRQDMGAPDERRDLGRVQRLHYGHFGVEFRDGRLFATLDLRGLGDDALRPREEVRLRHDGRPWEIGHRQITRTQVNVEYVLPGQSVQDWQELLSVQRIVGLVARGVPLKPFAAGIRAAFLDQAPEGTWRIIREKDDEIIYEFIVPKGSSQPAQHEVARLMVGDHDIHRVAYVRKGSPLGETERTRWIQALRRNRVRPTAQAYHHDEPVRPSPGR